MFRKLLNSIFFAIATIIFLSIQLNAQININHNSKKYKLFPELRLHFNQHLLSEPDIENSYGFGMSMFNQWYRFEHFNLVGGILFNQTSASVHKIDIKNNEYFTNIDYRINTIGLPILIRGNIGKPYIFFFETGVIPNFTISNKGDGMHFYSVLENIKLVPHAESWNKRTNHFKTFDMLINSNAGIKIPSNNLDFTLGAGIDYSMFKIHKYHSGFKNFFFNAFVGVGLR